MDAERVDVPPDVALALEAAERVKRFATIAQHMDMITSYSISCLEAARRHERGVVHIHLGQIRTELIEAIHQFWQLDGL